MKESHVMLLSFVLALITTGIGVSLGFLEIISRLCIGRVCYRIPLLYVIVLLMVWLFYGYILSEINKMLEKHPRVTPYLSVVLGLLAVGVLVYGYWQALQDAGVAYQLLLFIVSAHSFIFVTGAIVWIIGTIVFFLEIAGYTITWTGLTKNKMGIKDWHKTDIMMIAIGAIFYCVIWKAIGYVAVAPGFIIAPAYSIAPLFGMFFGIPGAFGAAVGGLFEDVLSGVLNAGSFGRFASNFLRAYIPYKFVKDPSFQNIKSIGEYYIWGVVFQPLISTFYCYWWYEFMYDLLAGTKFELSEYSIWVWAMFAPSFLLDNLIMNAFLVPVIGVISFSKVKALKLYWKDRVGATKIPQEVSRSRGEVAELAKAQPALITLPQPQSNSGIIPPATALEKELGELKVEVEKYRSYLSKLETLHAEGNVSDDAYQQLKREYAERLTELERKIEALKKERHSISYSST